MRYCCSPKPVGGRRIQEIDDVDLGADAGKVHTQERYWAWGRAFSDWTMLSSLGLGLASGGAAIAQAVLEDSNPTVKTTMSVISFVLLTGGIITQLVNNQKAVNQVKRQREAEGGGMAVGTRVPDICTTLTGWGVGLGGMVTTLNTGSVAGDILSLAGRLISLAGFTLTSKRFESEKVIIEERHRRYLHKEVAL